MIRELCERVFTVGRAVRAYAPDDDFNVIFAGLHETWRRHATHIPSSLQWLELQLSHGSLAPRLTPTEQWLLEPLIKYARAAGREDIAAWFEALKSRVLALLAGAARRQVAPG